MGWKVELQNEFMVMKSLELLEGTVEGPWRLGAEESKIKATF